MTRGLSFILPAFALALAAGPTLAAAAPTAPADAAAALGQLQHDNGRLQTTGWRLASANAPFCDAAAPAIGLVLLDARQFDRPAAIRAALGLAGDIAIDAVAEGSPAALAGLLPNREVLAIDGTTTAVPPHVGDPPFARPAALQDRIAAALAKHGKVTLTVADARGKPQDVTIAGKPACPVPFALEMGGTGARADRERVIVGQAFGATGTAAERIDEGEFAAALAHEMAHRLLGHPALLDRLGRTPEAIRRTEREADRLSLWLLANAGYDPQAGARLMRGWARRRDPGLARLPTHDAWEDRAGLMDREMVRLRAALQRRGQADWRQDFLRE